jgi:hypothetical protein
MINSTSTFHIEGSKSCVNEGDKKTKHQDSNTKNAPNGRILTPERGLKSAGASIL